MGVPCSCTRLVTARPLLSDSIRFKAYTSTFQPGGDATQLRKELVAYIQTNEKDMNMKLLVMFQKAINFPDQCLADISLSHCGMREGDWPHFMRLVYAGRNASSLEIRAVSLSMTGFNVICRSLEVLSNLKCLLLSDLGLGFYLLPDFTVMLNRLPQLTHLDLSGNVLGSGHVDDLLPALLIITSLQQIWLDRNEIDDKGAYAIAEKLCDFPQLEFFSIRLNLLTAEGMTALTEAAAKREKLQLIVAPKFDEADRGKQISESLI